MFTASPAPGNHIRLRDKPQTKQRRPTKFQRRTQAAFAWVHAKHVSLNEIPNKVVFRFVLVTLCPRLHCHLLGCGINELEQRGDSGAVAQRKRDDTGAASYRGGRKLERERGQLLRVQGESGLPVQRDFFRGQRRGQELRGSHTQGQRECNRHS
jgi:hypothetical protein